MASNHEVGSSSLSGCTKYANMKYVIKSVFRPVSNRHYTSKKVSVVLYAFSFFPAVLICLFGAIAVDSFFWIILAGIIVYGFIDYMVFDAFLDKLGWRLIWRHFYDDEVHQPTAEHDVMKAYEVNPSEENHQTLQKHLKKYR